MTRRLLFVALAATFALSSCSALRDREPFITDALTLSIDADGNVALSPTEVTGTWSYGSIQISNETGENHGFAIDELAVFAEIPRGAAPAVQISEARDGKDYVFYCHIHNPKGIEGLSADEIEYQGVLHIRYEEEGL